ncbi:MHC class II transactivator [Periophthalmus magnuspinnatus]|uniref:MHC class II transactivator n=1 Tax=Periophthalmus magnuspinnatus TaxID=409849 RepID=UPI002436EF20|nr:MHC class II transactivator [Periophthalmus magnuspinnatus]
MQEVDQVPDFLDDLVQQYLADENLDSFVDPSILLNWQPCEDEAESHRKGSALAGGAHEGLQGSKTTIQPYRRKRVKQGDGADTTSSHKKQRTRQAGAPGSCPEAVPAPVHCPSPCEPPPSILEIITISRKTLRSVVQTIKLPPLVRLPQTSTASAFILVPVSPEPKCHMPPLSPVNGAPAPAQPTSPSGSKSDVSPVSTCPQVHEKSPVSPKSHTFRPATKPMTQTVKSYIQETKAYMSRACEDMGDGLTLSSNYVDSKVIQRDTIRTGRNNNKSLDKELNVMGDTDRRKCTVQLNQIFEQSHGGRSKSCHLLVGKAGMGKTTCIKKLCRDWSMDCLPQFDFVFLLDGRFLTITEPKYSLETLLLHLSSFTPSCSNSDEVLSQIFTSPKRVLIICDGFEDLREFELLLQPLEKDVATSLQKERKCNTFTIRQLYSAILQRLVLPGCSLLLSSRPRGSASQLLRKVDNFLEITGFSPSDVEMYVTKLVPDPEVQKSTMKCLQNCDYLNLLCWNPGICQLVCTVLERQTDLDEVPRTLTEICFQVLRLKMNNLNDGKTLTPQETIEEVNVGSATRARRKSQKTLRRPNKKTGNQEENGLMSELSYLAWETVKMNTSIITSEFSVSGQTRAAGLETGLLNSLTRVRRKSLSNPENNEGKTDDGSQTTDDKDMEMEDVENLGYEILSWANSFLQSFLAAVHLSLSSSAFVKTLSFQSGSKGRRRQQREEFELTQRFAVGLLFQNQDDLLWLQPTNNLNSTMVTKQNALIKHLKHLQFGHLRPSQILDLYYFVYEGSFTHCRSSKLAKHILKNFPERLTFNGVPLCPADIHVIKNFMQHGGDEERRFSLDLQNCGIQVSGLKSLVGLDAIRTYRTCIVDVIFMWEELEQQKEESLLRDAVSKFNIDPFKATQVSHIEHLTKLVGIHTNKRLSECQMNSIFAEGVPAVKHLYKLELELGPEKGPLSLPMLWRLLPGLHNLQHLDLENNKIGDDGAQHLAKALVSLSSLETLNLSQNTIGDTGAQSLSATLTNLPRLDRLSLHSNVICDQGANSLAAVLRHMSALTELDIRYNRLTDIGAHSLGSSLKECHHMKSLRMWSQCIPYGVFERLQQQDPRIMDTF